MGKGHGGMELPARLASPPSEERRFYVRREAGHEVFLAKDEFFQHCMRIPSYRSLGCDSRSIMSENAGNLM